MMQESGVGVEMGTYIADEHLAKGASASLSMVMVSKEGVRLALLMRTRKQFHLSSRVVTFVQENYYATNTVLQD